MEYGISVNIANGLFSVKVTKLEIIKVTSLKHILNIAFSNLINFELVITNFKWSQQIL